MENTDHVVGEHGVLDVKDQSYLAGAEKSSVLSPLPLKKRGSSGSHYLGTDFASMTPEKKNEQSHIAREKEIAELPEKSRTLSEFFDRMLCSLRLLSLRKRSPTFQNVSSQVDVLTGRKFEHRHLAQIMYIIPEAVQIDKILVHDEETLCMKPDIRIMLHFDVVEDHHEHSMFMSLSNLFASRLKDFFHKHPQDFDIPEAMLPDPFNQRCLTSTADPLPVNLSSPPESSSLPACHLRPSFSPRFSRLAGPAEAKIDHLLLSSPIRSPCESECTLNQETDAQRRSPKSSKSSISLHTVEESQPPPACGLDGNERTPMKLSPESHKLMLETPAQPTPKRSVPISENKHKKVTGLDSAVSTLTVKRSLDFVTWDGEEMSSGLGSGNMDHHEAIDSVPKMEMKTISKEDHVTADVCSHEERSCSISKDEKIKQNHLTVAQRETLGLSDLVLLIHRIFQSVGCCSVTKPELVHKIIMNDYDVDENTDVEAQIELIERLVPDWLCKKPAPTGDLLYSISKVLDVNSVCERVIGV